MKCPAGRTSTDFISFADFAPTLLEACTIDPGTYGFSGRSFLDVLQSPDEGRVDSSRSWVLTGRERHGYCRPGNAGNPMRSLVTDEYLYIRNFIPGSIVGDVDNSPTRSLIESYRDDPEMKRYYELAFGPRPAEELYAADRGPDCLDSVADDPAYEDTLISYRNRLVELLQKQDDPRITGSGYVFDCYPYFGKPNPALTEGFSDIILTDYQLQNLPEGDHQPHINAVKGFDHWS